MITGGCLAIKCSPLEPSGSTGDAALLTYEKKIGEFEFAIDELTLKFEGMTNKGIGEFLQFLTARKLEEVGKVVNRRRQWLEHQQFGLSSYILERKANRQFPRNR